MANVPSYTGEIVRAIYTVNSSGWGSTGGTWSGDRTIESGVNIVDVYSTNANTLLVELSSGSFRTLIGSGGALNGLYMHLAHVDGGDGDTWSAPFSRIRNLAASTSWWTTPPSWRTSVSGGDRIEVVIGSNTPVPNTPATGAPTISGTARVGDTLTAGAGTIADADGLPSTTFPTGYSFQWNRGGSPIPGLPGDFDLAAGNTDPTGITWDGTYFRVVDGTDLKVYTYDANGVYQSAQDFNLDSANGRPRGITWDGTYYRVLDHQDRRVYAYNSSGVYVSAQNFDLGISGETQPQGITWDGTYIWVLGDTNNRMYAFTTAGARQSSQDFNLDSANSNANGVTWGDSYFYVSDASDDHLYVYSADGTYQSTNSFSLATANGNPSGGAYAGQRVYVLDITDDKVYAYTTDGTHRTSASSADGQAYVPVAADVGQTITVTISFTDGLNGRESRTSAPTAAVVEETAVTLTVGAPTVDDATPTNGDTVTFTSGDVGGTATGAISYQWQEQSGNSWSNISGATGSTYDRTEASAGTVTVRVRVRREGTTAFSSSVSATWSAAPAATFTVSISGPASRQNGQTASYSASLGGTATGAVAYQWQRRNILQPTWFNVGTGSTYSQAPEFAGTWQVRLVATRQGVSATSNTITTVWSAETFTVSISGPASRQNGQTASYSASLGGTATGAVAYQWQRRSIAQRTWFNVGTGSTYSQTQASAGTWLVRLVATRQGVSATSNVVTTVWSAAAPTTSAPSFSTSSGAAQSWRAGSPIASITVPAASGTPTPTYSAAGLPSGIDFDPSTLVLSGAPTGAGTGTITITATNTAGTDTYTIAYTVAAAAAPLALADFDVPNGQQLVTSALIEASVTGSSHRFGGGYLWVLANSFVNNVGEIGDLLAGSLEVTTGYQLNAIRRLSTTVFQLNDVPETDNITSFFASGGGGHGWTIHLQDDAGVASIVIADATVDSSSNADRWRLTVSGTFAAIMNRIGTGDRFILAFTEPAAALPDADAPSVSIDSVAAGNEGATVSLSATVAAGGTYDGAVEYAWAVEGGTLSDASAASPTWTRPSVTSDTDYDIDLTITVRGTGTNARSGTSDTAAATTVSATVRNVAVTTTDTDSIYILGTTAPGTPTGGTNAESHLPSGWSRTEPSPTTTQNVYRSQRTRTYSDGSFTSATAWGAPTKIADMRGANSQTITLPAARYNYEEVRRKEWTWIGQTDDPEIIDGLKASASDNRFLIQLRLWRTAQTPGSDRFLIVHLEDSVGAGTLGAGDDLSGTFESSGSITLTLSTGESITGLQRLSSDTAEQYRYDVGDGFTESEFDAVFNALGTTDGAEAGTLIIRDFEPAAALPDASAPTVSINAVATGDESTTVSLSATVAAGGTYDGAVEYAWAVEGGTLSDASAASPTWTRPSVTSDTDYDIDLTITVNGTGTNARSGTSDTATATTVTATVRNVPTATAPAKVANLAAVSGSDPTTDSDLTWDVPANGGAAITGYRVEYRVQGSGDAIWAHALPTTNSHTLTLSPDTTYEIRVRAINNVGSGPWSDVITFSTQPLAAPPVLSSAETSVDGSSLVLTFNKNLDESSVPAASTFMVMVGSEVRAVSAVAIDDDEVTLSLSTPVAHGDTGTVAYTAPGGS